MQINVHRNSLPRVYSLSCGGGVFGSTEFYLHFCPLENASLVLAPGKRKCGISPGKGELGGCREGHGSPLGERNHWNTSVQLVVVFFFSAYLVLHFVCAFQTKGKQKSAWLWKTSGDKKES